MKNTLFLFLTVLMISCGGENRKEKHGDKSKSGWGGDGESSNKLSDWRVLVETKAVASGSVAQQLITHGSLESEAAADITPEAAGVVTQINAEEGDFVTKGQLLAVLSSPSLEARNERAQVELLQAQRIAKQANTLHEQGAISDTEFSEAKATLAIAEASFREARKSRGFARLTSPINGTVAVRNVRLGELAGGAQPAFQVVDLDRLRVIVQLSEKDLSNLHTGQSVELAGAYDEDARASGSVLRISPVVDAQTGTVRVTIAVETGTTSLRPGQFVKVRIETDRHSDVLTIPRKAVYWQDGNPVAWRVIPKPANEDEEQEDDEPESEESGFFAKMFSDDDNEDDEVEKEDPWKNVPLRIVERVNLEVGYTDADLAEIVSGLNIDDQIVTLGGETLRPSAQIKLPGDPSPKKPDKKAEDKGGDSRKDSESR
jgi:membrane fusion protein (multidrug efflux system)